MYRNDTPTTFTLWHLKANIPGWVKSKTTKVQEKDIICLRPSRL